MCVNEAKNSRAMDFTQKNKNGFRHGRRYCGRRVEISEIRVEEITLLFVMDVSTLPKSFSNLQTRMPLDAVQGP